MLKYQVFLEIHIQSIWKNLRNQEKSIHNQEILDLISLHFSLSLEAKLNMLMMTILKTSHYLILLLTMAGGQGDKIEEPFWLDRLRFPQESDPYCTKRAKSKSLLSSLCLCRVDPFLQSCFVTQELSAASWVAPFPPTPSQVPQNNNNKNIFFFSISEALHQYLLLNACKHPSLLRSVLSLIWAEGFFLTLISLP